MKTNIRRKNYYLDDAKIQRVKRILGTRTETAAINAALDLVAFREDILRSIRKVAGKGGIEKVL